MTAEFLSEDFLLLTPTARQLYHQYAADMPIYDYHNHLPAAQIADDIQFANITRAWLAEDHYKWRAMRANGIAEQYVTGKANDYERFEKWAQTMPYCLCNPLYHWTHLELKNYFGIKKLLDPSTAKEIYNTCNEMLKTPQFSVRNLLRRSKVRLTCGIEQPLSQLEQYKKIRDDGFEIKVFTAFLADKTFLFNKTADLNQWIDQLSQTADMEITGFRSYIEAVQKRHRYFHENGCRISDRGISVIYAEDYTDGEIETIFKKIRSSKDLSEQETLKFRSAMMYEIALMDHEAGWIQMFHLGVIRNNSTRMIRSFGVDAGCDSMCDFPLMYSLSRFLDRLDKDGKLPKTIIFNLNPSINEPLITMLGNFQDGSVPGKMQYGAPWWFLDQKEGIKRHMTALSSLGLLRRFIGMLTDSRSFLSFARHEYFRRELCNFLGNQVEKGLLPKEMDLLGQTVKDICYNNATAYFPFEVD